MKIIYIVNARIPTEKAHGYQICKMCEEFSSAGAKVELWIPERANLIKKDAFLFHGIKPIFIIRRFNSFDFLKYKKFHKVAFFLQSLLFLLKLLNVKIDKDTLIYTRNPEIAFIFSKRSFNVVYEAHGWPKSKNFLYKFFLKKVFKIIAITSIIKKIHERNGIERNKILVAPDGVDLEKFDLKLTRDEARKKLKLPTNKFLVVYTGHLYKWKGIDTLIESSKILTHEILIYLIGGTESDIIKYRKKNINYKNVHIEGYKEHSEIPYWLKAADALVLPNSAKEEISKSYTSPLKLFEYMASNRPIIASDLPSIREILNNKNSILIEPDNYLKMAEEIKKLIADNKLARKISEQAFLDIKNYTWSKRVNNILAFLLNY